MIRRPPGSTRTDTLFPYTTLFRSLDVFFVAGVSWPRLMGHPQPPHGHDAVAQAAADFALDDRQVAALEDLRRRLAEQRESRRGERDSFQALIIDALRRPD